MKCNEAPTNLQLKLKESEKDEKESPEKSLSEIKETPKKSISDAKQTPKQSEKL